MAEDVEVKRLVRGTADSPVRDPPPRRGRSHARSRGRGPQAISERLLALATLDRESEHVVRRAWRSAQRLDAELDVLVVRPPERSPSAEDRARLEELRRLVAMLGARLRVEEGEDVAAVTIAVARALGSTYVLMGTPAPRRGLARASDRSLLMRLLRGLPGVDVRIVADPTLREADEHARSGNTVAAPRGAAEDQDASPRAV